jgi:hypothetical protein
MASRRHHASRAGEPVRRAGSRSRDRARPPRPVDEAAVRAVHRPDMGRDPSLGAAHRVPQRAVLDVLLRGRPREVGVPHPPRHLDRLHDLGATSATRWWSTASKRDPMVCGSTTGGSYATQRRAGRAEAHTWSRDRVRRPRALDRRHRVPRRDDGDRRGRPSRRSCSARRSIPLAHRADWTASCVPARRPVATTAPPTGTRHPEQGPGTSTSLTSRP